jgi:hypothetical protein
VAEETAWPGEKAQQGAVLRWQAKHDLTCWRVHAACALARARDIHLAHREHHAAEAAKLAEVLARHLQHLPPREDAPGALIAARALLERAHAVVPPNRKKPRSRRRSA